MDFEAKPDFVPGEEVRYNVSYERSVTIPDDDHRKGVAGLEITLGWNDENDEKVDVYPFDLKLRVVGLFEWLPPRDDRDTFEAWLEWNGAYLLWPYARSYIASITALSPWPSLTVYTLRVPDPPAKKTVQRVVESTSSSAAGKPPGRAKSAHKPPQPIRRPKRGGSAS